MTIIAMLCMALPVSAKTDDEERSLLIINSYTENAPWARTMIYPIATHVASMPNVHCETAHLNNILVTDSVSYVRTAEHLFSRYGKVKKPDYVVLIGYLALTLRDSVKQRWGDETPMLLITRTGSYRSARQSVVGYQYGAPVEHPLTDLREDYNITVVEDRDHYKETIDLMDRLIPDMDTLVYISDGMPLNRSLDDKIRRYLRSDYPNLTYHWLKTDSAGVERLYEYYVERTPRTGLLISSWNIISKDTRGNNNASMGAILYMNGSSTPIFCLRQPYMDYGAVGGVYSDPDVVKQSIIMVVDSMLAGASMHSIPYQHDNESIIPILNYENLMNYGLDPDLAPDGTIFVHRPESFWDRHLWHVIAVSLLVLLVLVLMASRAKAQASRIKTLRRHADFVNYMPLPFSKATILFDSEGKVRDIEYKLYNESFGQLLKENSRPGLPTKMFPYEFIAPYTKKLMEDGEPVKFIYTFDKSGRTYDFLLCSVSLRSDKHRSPNSLREVDLFAMDITDRINLENDLKKVTHRFDTTISVSGLLPWLWYVKDDVLVFDAYSLDRRITRDLNRPTLAVDSRLTCQEYLELVPEADRQVLVDIRQGLLDGTIKEFSARYRLKMARHGRDIFEWMDARGVVTEYDPVDHKPLVVTGSVYVITEFMEEK